MIREFAIAGTLAIATVFTGCSSRDAFRHTFIGVETDRLVKMLEHRGAATDPTAAGAAVDTVFVAGFPQHIVDQDGSRFTVFSLANARYNPGSPGGMSTRVDPRTGIVTTRSTPPTSASISLHAGHPNFGVAGEIPIVTRRRWVFFHKPYLYYFSAVHNGKTVVDSGSDLKLLRLSDAKSSSPWSPLRPPALPPHLDRLTGSAIFIAKHSYDLGGYGALVPVLFGLEFDHEATRKLYQRLLDRDFTGDFAWQDADIRAMLAWLEAYPAYGEAAEYLADRRTPWFIGLDRENLVRRRRLKAATTEISKSLHRDPNWADAQRLAVAIDEARQACEESAAKPLLRGGRFGGGVAARLLPNARGYEGLEEGERTCAALAPYGHYQLQRNISVTSGSEAVRIISSSTSVKAITVSPDQIYVHVDYQTPVRIQLGSRGWRLQLTAGAVRLVDELYFGGQTYRGTGTAVDVAMSLVPRRGYGFDGSEARWFKKSGLIEVGYRSGRIGKYTAAGAGIESPVIGPGGQVVKFRPQGLWLACNVDVLRF